jgi:hypothetical protein
MDGVRPDWSVFMRGLWGAALTVCGVVCLGVGCRDKSPPSEMSPNAPDANSSLMPSPHHIARYIGAVPTWSQLQPGSSDADAALRSFDELSDLPTPLVHQAVMMRFHLDHEPDSDDPQHTRLFLFNRCFFNVPADPMSAQLMPPWTRSEVDPRGPLWPVGVGPDGKPTLIGRHQRNECPIYDPVAEFMVFHQLYGRRDGKP